MELRVVLLCIVSVYGRSNPYYRPSVGLESRDSRGQSSNVKEGFVQPLDFTSFTNQFEAEDRSGQGGPFAKVKPPLTFDAKKSSGFQASNTEFPQFSGPIFPPEKEGNKTGFVQPLKFVSPFDEGCIVLSGFYP